MNARRRLLAVAAAGLLPWVVVVSGGGGTFVSFVLAFGIANPVSLHYTSLPAYLFVHTRGLPPSLLAWPISTLLWLLSLASGASGLITGREDRRLTGGLLVLAGASLVPVATVVGRPPSVTAVPLGTVILWSVAWWGYQEPIRRIVSGGPTSER